MAIGIISGCISSIIVWWILNIVLTPSLKIDDNIQYKRAKRYIRVKNKSWFNIYDVVCRVEFLQGSKSDSYKRADSPLPFLEHRNGVYAISLSGDEYTYRFFENIDEKSKLNITCGNDKVDTNTLNLLSNFTTELFNRLSKNS